MQRRLTTILCALLIALFAGSCAQRKVIPDDELAEIFHDVYLSNAYLGVKYANIDSLMIYEPILAEYGYTPEDLRYTIGNFSRRKSAQLGTVLKQAEDRLVNEAKVYEQKVMVLDTIRDIAVRKFRRTINCDSVIKVRRLADTAALRIIVDPVYAGTYAVRFNYTCDDDLAKYPRQCNMWLETKSGNRRSTNIFRLRKEDSARRSFSVDTSVKRLIIWMGETVNEKHASRKPNITIRNLQIIYTPDEQLAIDSLFKSFVDIRIFSDEFFPKTDSLTLAPDSTGVH